MKFRDLLGIDFLLLFAALILTLFGILFIYSSGVDSTGIIVSEEYIRQIIWGAAGLILALMLALMNYRRIYHFALYLYLGTLILVLYTVIAGREIHGARAWVGIGNFGIQPSEFAKITTILCLAQYLDLSRRSTSDFKRFALSCVIAFVPMFFVLLQPDFGTSLVFIPILLVMTFIAGIKMRYILFVISVLGIGGILLLVPFWQKHIVKITSTSLDLLSNVQFIAALCSICAIIFFIAFFGLVRYKKRYFYWIDYFALLIISALAVVLAGNKMLKEYQINRLVVFLDPYVDPRGAGWHIIQSMTAVGSGGALGKGYMQGTQSHYRFLPTQSTDFIFSIFSEEWGFLGGVLLFVLFLTVCLRLIKIMKNTTDPFGCYIAGGLAAIYSFHFLVNVGMAMGIMPITGIPLLFMSYGGSALLSAMAGIGLALSIYIRRFQF
ncbi:MAG: rod shape-determining protein RodA [Spirochaetaceae bacterium]|jgi:rod shape determining protein RodA|nr:rod shape-determining protein RodA [Spirochaetaceae bacterium]